MADIKRAFAIWARGGGSGVVVYSDTLPNGAAIIRISGWVQAVHPCEALPPEFPTPDVEPQP